MGNAQRRPEAERQRSGTIAAMRASASPVPADASERASAVAAWVAALRRRASAAELQQLPPLTEAEAAQAMALLRAGGTGGMSAQAQEPTQSPVPADDDSVPGRFRPRLTLTTLTRGDGLLGLRAHGRIGPRADAATLVTVHWTYRTDAGHTWEAPAPTTVLNSRPARVQELFDMGGPVVRMRRDLAAESDALDRLWALGLAPVDPSHLQWRHREMGATLGPVWTLPQEAQDRKSVV